MIKKSTLAAELQNRVTALRNRYSEIQEKSAQLSDEREALLSEPLRIEDVKQFVCDYIDACAAQYPVLAELPKLFDSMFYPLRNMSGWTETVRKDCDKVPPLCLRDTLKAVENPPAVGVFYHGLNFFGSASDINRACDFGFYFFFGDIIKQRVCEYLDKLPEPYLPVDQARVGKSITEIQAQVDVIDTSLSQLSGEKDALEAEFLAYNAGPLVPVKSESPAEAGQRMRKEDRDKAILYAWNGRNAAELARKFCVSVREVEHIGRRGREPFRAA